MKLDCKVNNCYNNKGKKYVYTLYKGWIFRAVRPVHMRYISTMLPFIHKVAGRALHNFGAIDMELQCVICISVQPMIPTCSLDLRARVGLYISGNCLMYVGDSSCKASGFCT